MEAKIEAKTLPKTAKFGSRKQIPKMIEISAEESLFFHAMFGVFLLVSKLCFVSLIKANGQKHAKITWF